MTSKSFVGRNRELAYFKDRHTSPNCQLLILHGRRRIGKTRLIKELLSKIGTDQGFYYLATLKDAPLQRQEFQQLLGEQVSDSLLIRQSFSDWEALLTYVLLHYPKVTLIFDEFPYLLSADPAIASIMQKVWDEHAARVGAKWILLGSQVSVMEELLSTRSPLYGRRTGSWHLRPLSFDDFCQYSGLDGMEALRYFSVAGGIPYYWEHLRFDNFDASLLSAVLETGSLLYDEGTFLVREELREPREYFSLLYVLSRGPRKLGELCQELGIGKNIASKYLAVLQGLHMIERRIPVTRQGQYRTGLYAVCDPFLRFWFRYVFPYKTSLEMGNTSLVLNYLHDQFNHHLGATYEEVAMEQLLQQANQAGLPISHHGRWWVSKKGQQYEIDGVILGEGETWCLEAKISNRVNVKRFSKAVNALHVDAAAHGINLGRIKLFGFEAQRCFSGTEVDFIEL